MKSASTSFGLGTEGHVLSRLYCLPLAILLLPSVLQNGPGGRQILQGDSQRFEDGDVVGGAVLGVGGVDLLADDVPDLADQNLSLEGLLVDLTAFDL